MSWFARGSLLILLLGSTLLPIFASRGGWGLPSERDPYLWAEQEECDVRLKTANGGRCPRTHRSTFGRSRIGGGSGFGK